jgi:hypothetical protein
MRAKNASRGGRRVSGDHAAKRSAATERASVRSASTADERRVRSGAREVIVTEQSEGEASWLSTSRKWVRC